MDQISITLPQSKEGKQKIEIRPHLHLLSGTILMLFALSHFGFLKFTLSTMEMPNVVFTFLTNWYVYLIAGIFEAFVALFCFKFRGRNVADGAIWTFLGVILWYRWAFWYTGGRSCGCLGLLGHLLHLSKLQEKLLPEIALIVLAVSTAPCICKLVFQSIKKRVGSAAVFLFILQSFNLGAGQIIEVRGQVYAEKHNPKTGEVYSKSKSHGNFQAVICGDLWRFSVTNVDDGSFWSEVVYDGTNTYVIVPAGQYYQHGVAGDKSLNTARVIPSADFLPIGRDDFGLTIGWLTYGLSPRTVEKKKGKNGAFEIPLPWETRMVSFGFKWSFEFDNTARFLKTASAVRDHQLDINQKDEILRPEIRYPEDLSARNEYMVAVGIRKAIPTGFVGGRYSCKEWKKMENGNLIPASSELETFDSPFPHPSGKMRLKADEISIKDGNQEVLPKVEVRTSIDDYRCRKVGSDRILSYGKYTLQPGETWKKNGDAFLAKITEEEFKDGTKLDFTTRSRNILAWMLLAVLCGPVAFMLWKKTTTKPRNNR